MANIQINPTRETPAVLLDGDKGFISIRGRSLAQNSITFFLKIFSWVDEYFKSPKSTTTVELKLEYFNSTSNKLIIDLLIKIKSLLPSGNKLEIIWYYLWDDEEMLEQGKELSRFLSLDFEYKAI